MAEVSECVMFDRSLWRARMRRRGGDFTASSFLHQEIFAQLSDHLLDFKRSFGRGLEILGHPVDSRLSLRGHPKIGDLVTAALFDTAGADVVLDDETLPFGAGTFDLIVSNLALQAANDLVGVLVQMQRALTPDGLLLASLLGGQTFQELRTALFHAEMDTMNGASPRVAPFATVQDIGALLQRAGFTLPVVHSQTLTVTYADLFALMRDVRGAGLSNILARRHRGFTPRRLFERAAALYQERFADGEGRLMATIEVITLTAFHPHAHQPQPLRRGTGDVPLHVVFPQKMS